MACASAWTTGGCASPARTRRTAAVRLQVLGERRRPTRAAAARRVARHAGDAEPAATARAKRLDRRRAEREPVVGLGAGVRRRALDRVETVHLRRDRHRARRRDANARACRTPAGRCTRKSASRDRMTSASSIAYCASTYSPNARRLPRARDGGPRLPLDPLRLRDSASRSSSIWAASVGEATVSVRMRMPGAPASPAARSARSRIAPMNAPNGRISPRFVSDCERSGS